MPSENLLLCLLGRNDYDTPSGQGAGARAAVTSTPSDSAASPITDARLQEAYNYWRRKCAARPLPRWADLDPMEIPKLLPHIILVDVEPEKRYRFRLIGTETERAHGFNATGRYLDEVLKGPEYRDHVLAMYDQAIGQRRPIYSESLFLSPEAGAVERHTKILFMPISDDGEAINLVFVAQIFLYLDPATRDRHLIDARPYKEISHAVL